jgi:hypothetical protein
MSIESTLAVIPKDELVLKLLEELAARGKKLEKNQAGEVRECQMDHHEFEHLLALGLAYLGSLSSLFSHFSFLFLRPYNTSFAPLYLYYQ